MEVLSLTSSFLSPPPPPFLFRTKSAVEHKEKAQASGH